MENERTEERKKGVQFYDEPVNKSPKIPVTLGKIELLKKVEKARRNRRGRLG